MVSVRHLSGNALVAVEPALGEEASAGGSSVADAHAGRDLRAVRLEPPAQRDELRRLRSDLGDPTRGGRRRRRRRRRSGERLERGLQRLELPQQADQAGDRLERVFPQRGVTDEILDLAGLAQLLVVAFNSHWRAFLHLAVFGLLALREGGKGDKDGCNKIEVGPESAERTILNSEACSDMARVSWIFFLIHFISVLE